MLNWKSTSRLRPAQDAMVPLAALCVLLVMLAWAIVGPSGLLAWGESSRMLQQRREQLVRVMHERDVMRNRVNLLAQDHVNPDMASELLRKKLNVTHRDDVILMVP
jgi:cell division protein FtsB